MATQKSLNKLVDWNIEYEDFITENYKKPFKWGSWDCCMFSDALIKRMSGSSLIPNTLKWKDEETALKAISGYGKDLQGSIKKAALAKGLIKIEPQFMQKGDLCVVLQETQLCGICDGYKVIGPSEDGIARIEFKEILAVWRIPNV